LISGIFHCLNIGSTVENERWKRYVVERAISNDRLFQIVSGYKAIDFQDAGDPAVKPIGHNVDQWRLRFCRKMLNCEFGT